MENTKEKNITLSRILKLIKENGLNGKTFAKSCSLSPGNVTDWKTGRSKPSLTALRKISKKYNVQLEWLTGDCRFRTKQEEFEEKMRKSHKNLRRKICQKIY